MVEEEKEKVKRTKRNTRIATKKKYIFVEKNEEEELFRKAITKRSRPKASPYVELQNE